ncbi:MAG: DUF3048 domain-containing protein, partial [Herbiconiux sp.]|nr:DUF3048 domain-containing protein [Herbiconiux sp.]
MSSPRLRARSIAAAALAVLSAGILTGCSWVSEAITPAVTPTAMIAPEPAPPQTAPLRGTPVVPGALPSPALAAKIDNHEDARPQLGLDSADLVFEELVEGGLTRYAAVWQSSVPELIGPVRSIRPMDPDILTPLGGIVAYSGGQQQFVDMMRATPVYNAVHGESDTEETFFRADDRESPHDVMVEAAELAAAHSDLPAPAAQFDYAADLASSTAASSGEPTSSLALVFSEARFPSWG